MEGLFCVIKPLEPQQRGTDQRWGLAPKYYEYYIDVPNGNVPQVEALVWLANEVGDSVDCWESELQRTREKDQQWLGVLYVSPSISSVGSGPTGVCNLIRQYLHSRQSEASLIGRTSFLVHHSTVADTWNLGRHVVFEEVAGKRAGWRAATRTCRRTSLIWSTAA